MKQRPRQSIRSDSLSAMLLHACFFIVLALPIGTVSRAEAQSEASFVFFHGAGATSRATVDARNQDVKTHQRAFNLVLDPGAEVCVVVINAHPVLYRYSLDLVVDTIKPEIPDLSVLHEFMTRLSDYVTTDESKRAAIQRILDEPGLGRPIHPDTLDERLDVMIRALAVLKEDVDSANAAARRSDQASVAHRESDDHGFRGAVKTIVSLPAEKFRFNDTLISKNHAEELKKVRAWAGNDRQRLVIADGLAAMSQLLLTARDRLRSDYSRATPHAPRICKTVAPGRNTMTLMIAKASETATRDVYSADSKGPPYLRMVVESRYQRRVVSLDPLTLGVFAADVPVFAIRNDTLRQDGLSNPVNARPGLMLSLNPISFGTAGRWGLGIGPAVGFSGDKVIGDFLGVAALSYEDLVRFGVGWGRSSQPKSVRGVAVGERIPGDFGELQKAVERGFLNSNSWYLLLAFPGLSLVK